MKWFKRLFTHEQEPVDEPTETDTLNVALAMLRTRSLDVAP